MWTSSFFPPKSSVAISATQNNSIFPSFLHLILHSKSSWSPHMTAHFLQPLTGSLLFLWHPALPILACCCMTRCQCPQRAYSHFYCSECWWCISYGVCQCPQRASSHFYECISDEWKHCKCVNALNGLTPISTVASRNPWFYWLPRAIFTSN